MIGQYKIEIYGKVQIWTEFHVVNQKEIHLNNHHDYAADCVLIFDRETKVALKSVHCSVDPVDAIFFGEVGE